MLYDGFLWIVENTGQTVKALAEIQNFPGQKFWLSIDRVWAVPFIDNGWLSEKEIELDAGVEWILQTRMTEFGRRENYGQLTARWDNGVLGVG